MYYLALCVDDEHSVWIIRSYGHWENLTIKVSQISSTVKIQKQNHILPHPLP